MLPLTFIFGLVAIRRSVADLTTKPAIASEATCQRISTAAVACFWSYDEATTVRWPAFCQAPLPLLARGPPLVAPNYMGTTAGAKYHFYFTNGYPNPVDMVAQIYSAIVAA